MATSSSQPFSSLVMARASSMSLVLAPSMVKKGTGQIPAGQLFLDHLPLRQVRRFNLARLWRASTHPPGHVVIFLGGDEAG